MHTVPRHLSCPFMCWRVFLKWLTPAQACPQQTMYGHVSSFSSKQSALIGTSLFEACPHEISKANCIVWLLLPVLVQQILQGDLPGEASIIVSPCRTYALGSAISITFTAASIGQGSTGLTSASFLFPESAALQNHTIVDPAGVGKRMSARVTGELRSCPLAEHAGLCNLGNAG